MSIQEGSLSPVLGIGISGQLRAKKLVGGALAWLTKRDEIIAAALAEDEVTAAVNELGPELLYSRSPVMLIGESAEVLRRHVRTVMDHGVTDILPFNDQSQ